MRLNVRVIFSPATAGTRAAQQATTMIPIVFAGVADPIGSGFVMTLAKPGGNITGLTALNVELSGKRLELLRATVPGLKHIGILVDPQDPAYDGLVREARTAGARIGLTVTSIEVKDPATLPEVLSRERRLGTMADSRPYVEAGALMAYGTDYGDLARRAATYVDKILKGPSG